MMNGNYYINMKKLIGFMALALLAGCGRGNQSDGSSVDSVGTDTASTLNPADHTVAEAARIYLSAHALGHMDTEGRIDSVNGIMVGIPIEGVPDSIAGIYTSKKSGSGRDASYIEFYEEDAPRFVVYDFGEGNVDVINLVGSDVRIRTLKGDLAIGDRMGAVLDLPGVTAEWSGEEGRGSWYWCWEGLWFAPDQRKLSTELSHRLYHSGQAPTMKDFDDEDVRIGFIGTGLPF